ncbi:hypothetical protein LTR53_011988 [Teratosphaeriaceae sp. CCFEE 6253]|nr:hypothetical protein LTR53_011988 [Teratosphaeriaceae sp. CCFEE 6253]
MDCIQHMCQKIAAERMNRRSTDLIAPPPPYTPSDTDGEDADSDPEDVPAPLKLTVNAAHSVQGSNNLLPTSPTALSDATRFSTLLLAAIHQINNAASAKRSLKVDLTINCGVTVIGDRNVIGNVGLKPKSPSPPAALVAAGPGIAATTSVRPASAVAGAKRRAEDDDDVSVGPPVKRVALGDEHART